MEKPMYHHKDKRYPTSCLVHGREDEGRMLIVKAPGEARTRVAPMTAEKTVRDVSFLVPSRDVYDQRIEPENMLKRPMLHHAGRKYPRTARIRGKREDDLKFIVAKGAVETRLIDMDNGVAIGASYLVPTDSVIETGEAIQQRVTIDGRGTIVVPALIRHKLGLSANSILELTAREGGFIARVVPPCPTR